VFYGHVSRLTIVERDVSAFGSVRTSTYDLRPI
jgi:hypothetical protein